MVRTQLQLDDDTYEIIRNKAHHERQSISSIVRTLLRESLNREQGSKHPDYLSMDFIASGDSGRSDISVKHDEFLTKDFR